MAREADQKFIRERAEKAKAMREDRFKRLVDAVCDHGGLNRAAILELFSTVFKAF